MQDDTSVQEGAVSEQPSDFEAGFDGVDNADRAQNESQDSDEADQDSEKPEAETNESEDNDGSSEDDVKAHNRKFAEARLAAKQRADEANASFLADLRADVFSELEQPDPGRYEDIAEEQGLQAAEMQKQLDELKARDEQREAEAFIAGVEQQRSFIGTNIAQAESKIPLFNPESSEYNADLHQMVLADWAAANLETAIDNHGNVQILGMKENAVTPFEYLTERAELMMRIIGDARLKGQAAAEKNSQQAEPMSSSVVVSSTPDDFTRGFDLG